MAAKKKELLEQESMAIGTEETGAAYSGTILPEGAVDSMEEDMDHPSDVSEADLDLDELLAGMEPDPESGAYFADGDSKALEEPGADAYAAGLELTSDTAGVVVSDDMGDRETAEGESAATESAATAGDLPPVKPKKATGKKKETKTTDAAERPAVMESPNAAEAPAIMGGIEAASAIMEGDGNGVEAPAAEHKGITDGLAEDREQPAAALSPSPSPAPRRTSRRPAAEAPVLTIEARSEVETAEEREDVIWHEIHNAYRTRRILMGQLCGIEQTDTGKTIAIADYKGFRIVIPLKEMMIQVGRSPSGQAYADLMLRQNKILNNMLGAHIDFVVKGIDSKTRSVVASRQEAMLKKRQIFYLDTDSSGMYRIYEGRIVQARIVAVAEKVIRVEIFGVECSIMARDLAWDWVGDAHERFSVGDEVLVRVLGVRRDSLEEIGVKADIKSVTQNNNSENLKKCRIQSKYAGKVTDVHKGVVYVRLSNGVNAVAHSCYDQRMPGKKDDVSFAVTRIDDERGVAVGIITRIIRQNL